MYILIKKVVLGFKNYEIYAFIYLVNGINYN